MTAPLEERMHRHLDRRLKEIEKLVAHTDLKSRKRDTELAEIVDNVVDSMVLVKRAIDIIDGRLRALEEVSGK